MLKALLSFFGGNIAGELRKAYEAKLYAINDEERIAAEVAISQLELRQASLSRGGLVSTWVQVLWAAPFVIYNIKLIVWDKVLGWGVTDPLSEHLYQIEMMILGFYFLRAIVSSTRR